MTKRIQSIVALSGGKDSVATLLKVRAEGWKPKVVFCDTGWEHPMLYEYLKYLEKALGIDIIFLKSNKYEDFIDMVIQKKRFPSTLARFCSELLKVHPMIDYLLDEVADNFLVFQGIRKNESQKRSKMNESCTFFRYYLEPYGFDKKDKPRYHKYRRSDVLEFVKRGLLHDVQRPVFHLTADECFKLHAEYGIDPNPQYKANMGRVGCFPCVMVTHDELWQIYLRFPWRIDELIEWEKKLGTTFFPPGYVPKRYASKEVSFKYDKSKLTQEEIDYLQEYLGIEFDEHGKAQGKMKVNTVEDVIRYLKDKHAQGHIFEEYDKRTITSCDSIYNICE